MFTPAGHRTMNRTHPTGHDGDTAPATRPALPPATTPGRSPSVAPGSARPRPLTPLPRQIRFLCGPVYRRFPGWCVGSSPPPLGRSASGCRGARPNSVRTGQRTWRHNDTAGSMPGFGNDMMAGTNSGLTAPGTCRSPGHGRHDAWHGTAGVLSHGTCRISAIMSEGMPDGASYDMKLRRMRFRPKA